MCEFRRLVTSSAPHPSRLLCEQYFPIQDLFANSVQAATNPLVRSIVSPNLANNSNASMAPLCGRYINVCIARQTASIYKGVGFWGIQSVFAKGLNPRNYVHVVKKEIITHKRTQ